MVLFGLPRVADKSTFINNIITCIVLIPFLFFRDGQLKRIKAKKEWKERQQEEFSKRLKVEQN